MFRNSSKRKNNLRTLASVIGNSVASFRAVRLGPSLYRNLTYQK